MTILSAVLAIKILGTMITAALPFLLLPEAKLGKLTGIAGGGKTVFRLYGMAIVALNVGYCFGFPLIAAGVFPTAVVVVGLVSNGGAAAILFGLGAWKRSKLNSFLVLGIAIGLAFCLAFQELAIA